MTSQIEIHGPDVPGVQDVLSQDALDGLVAAHGRHVRKVHADVAWATQTEVSQVGGGTGHCPAFAGWVGPDSYPGQSRLLYGGSAGPGTYHALGSAVDGLFVGRFAHDARALAQVVTEVLASGKSRTASLTSIKE